MVVVGYSQWRRSFEGIYPCPSHHWIALQVYTLTSYTIGSCQVGFVRALAAVEGPSRPVPAGAAFWSLLEEFARGSPAGSEHFPGEELLYLKVSLLVTSGGVRAGIPARKRALPLDPR